MIGLGLALAQPKLPVVVITGDGEMLMGMGSLATVGLQKPGNLSIVVLDNEAYGETGGQTSHTSAAADLVGVAKACGIADSPRDHDHGRGRGVCHRNARRLGSGPRFANVKIDGANLERVLSSRDGLTSSTASAARSASSRSSDARSVLAVRPGGSVATCQQV